MEPFSHIVQATGDYEAHQIFSPDQQQSMVVIPEMGGILTSLRLGGVEVLDGCRYAGEIRNNRWAKSIFLYPFPNRLDNGIYEWNQQMYQFPINDPVNQSAIHGFGRDQPMYIERPILQTDQARIIMQYEYEGEYPAYPFPFRFKAEFVIQNDQSFNGKLSFWNTGEEDLPLGFGWHPYFQLGESIETLQLHLPKLHMLGLDQRMLPTGKRYPFDQYAGAPKVLQAKVFDNCFHIPNADYPEQYALSIASTTHRLHYWQETGKRKFNYLQLFTPPNRQSIAIEPMSCTINALNTGQGLIRLHPDESVSARFGLYLEVR